MVMLKDSVLIRVHELTVDSGFANSKYARGIRLMKKLNLTAVLM